MGPAAGPGGSWTTRTSPRRRWWLPAASVGEAVRTAWRGVRSAGGGSSRPGSCPPGGDGGGGGGARRRPCSGGSVKRLAGAGPLYYLPLAGRAASRKRALTRQGVSSQGTQTSTQPRAGQTKGECPNPAELISRRVSVSARIARSPRCGRCMSTPLGSSCRPCSTCRRTASTVPWCMWRQTQGPGRTTHQTCARHRRAALPARTAKSQGCARCSWRRTGSTCSLRTRSRRTGPNDSSCACGAARLVGQGAARDVGNWVSGVGECGTKWRCAVRDSGALAVRYALGVLLCALGARVARGAARVC